MTDYTTIEIDFDVHRKIVNEMQGFHDKPNDALRRLLDLPPKSAGVVPAPKGRAWMGKGVTLPHGTELRMEYNGRVHIGEIRDGFWIVEGLEFKSPSAAAGGVATTKDGGKPSLDGWVYWHAKRPGENKWTAISFLRAAESADF